MMYWTEIRSRGALRCFSLTKQHSSVYFLWHMLPHLTLIWYLAIPLWSLGWASKFHTLRNTKRHISQDIMEWEEENPDGEVPDAPKLDWGFMAGNGQDGDAPAVPGYLVFKGLNHMPKPI